MKYVLLVILFCIQSIYAQKFYQDLENDLQKQLDEIISEHQFPGITFSILFDKKHQINLVSGYSDTEKQIPLSIHNKMLSGSVGKIFFSAIVLKLAEQKKLNLDDNALIYLRNKSWFKTFPNYKEIKIVNLLNHTSGLPRHLFQPEFLQDFIKNPLKKRLPEECIQSISNKPAVHPVGKGWSYSDTNYILLGLIIEHITKENIYELVERTFIEPLELKNTVPTTTNEIKGIAGGYIGPQNPFQLPKKVLNENGKLVLDPSFEWTGGGFATTPADLTKFLKYMHEGNYLGKKSKTKLKVAINMATGKEYDNGYGLGIFIWSKMDDTRYGHSGFFPGYVSHVEYSKNRQYAIAIQVNDDGAYPLLQQIIYNLELTVDKYLGEIDEQKILQNFKDQENCWNKGDIECYMQAYATSVPIQTASRAGITYGYDNIINNYKKYFPKDKMGKLHFDNIKTRKLVDNIYFVTGRFNLKFNNRQELVRGWFSVNAKKINGEWYMITDHSS